jgi:LysM repeat protein
MKENAMHDDMTPKCPISTHWLTGAAMTVMLLLATPAMAAPDGEKTKNPTAVEAKAAADAKKEEAKAAADAKKEEALARARARAEAGNENAAPAAAAAKEDAEEKKEEKTEETEELATKGEEPATPEEEAAPALSEHDAWLAAREAAREKIEAERAAAERKEKAEQALAERAERVAELKEEVGQVETKIVGVRRGDTLARIAARNYTTPAMLIALNEGLDEKSLRSFTSVVVPDVPRPTTPAQAQNGETANGAAPQP